MNKRLTQVSTYKKKRVSYHMTLHSIAVLPFKDSKTKRCKQEKKKDFGLFFYK
jgi:hypothetical protein